MYIYISVPCLISIRSEVGDVSFQGIGDIDSTCVSVGVWAGEEVERYDRGVVFYVGADKRVQGVLLWNLGVGEESVARSVLAMESGRGLDDVPALAKKFKIFD